MEITTPIRSVLDRKGPALWSVPPDCKVYDAIALMAEKNIGAVPVLKDGVLLGMLTERDYTRKVILKGRSSQTTAAADIMLPAEITVSPLDSVQACLQLMTNHRLRHLPVVEDSKLVGILSIGDLVNWIIGTQDATIQHLENYLTGNYPT